MFMKEDVYEKSNVKVFLYIQKQETLEEIDAYLKKMHRLMV